MSRIFLVVAFLCLPFIANAQDSIPVPGFKQLQRDYIWASAEDRAKMDMVFKETEDNFKAQQITNIGGIEFGISYESAREKLVRKYGEPEYYPSPTALYFENKKYAGYDFDSIIFMFESDGVNSYLNGCIFLLQSKTKKDAKKNLETLNQLLSKKYDMEEYPNEYGYKTYVCGVSPVWDGHWYTLEYDMFSAIHTDIIEYENIDSEGNRFGARLIYGPYSYVKEEF